MNIWSRPGRVLAGRYHQDDTILGGDCLKFGSYCLRSTGGITVIFYAGGGFEYDFTPLELLYSPPERALFLAFSGVESMSGAIYDSTAIDLHHRPGHHPPIILLRKRLGGPAEVGAFFRVFE